MRTVDELAEDIRAAAEGIEAMANRIAEAADNNRVVMEVWDLPGKARRLMEAAQGMVREVEGRISPPVGRARVGR